MIDTPISTYMLKFCKCHVLFLGLESQLESLEAVEALFQQENGPLPPSVGSLYSKILQLSFLISLQLSYYCRFTTPLVLEGMAHALGPWQWI